MKKTVWIAALIMLFAILGGCAQNTANVQTLQPGDPVSLAPSATQETAEAAMSPTPSATQETAEAAMSPTPFASQPAEAPSVPAESCPTPEAVSQAPSGSVEEIIATGIYQGQVDNNFIEVLVDGQPEESAYMVFMLTGAVKDNFQDLDLNTGESVVLTHYKNEAGQLVLTQFSEQGYG